MHRNASLLLGRQIADRVVVIQDVRPERCIAKHLRRTTRDGGSVLGQEAANRAPSISAFLWLVVQWTLFSSADIPEKHTDVTVFFLLMLWVKARALCSKYSRREEVLGKQGGHDRTAPPAGLGSATHMGLP